MTVYYLGDYIEIEIGQEFTVARSGRGHTTFGEPAILTRTTKQHLVFTTQSGKTVKTRIDNLAWTVGKAAEAGYFVINRKFEDIENIIHFTVRF